MIYTGLGSTDIKVSRIGLGTVKFGRNQGVRYPEPFELPDDKTLLDLLACAHDFGINLLDTAPAYGSSEERLGKLLKTNRKNWIICTKAGEEFVEGASCFNFSPEAMRVSVERSLKRLKTDYIDILLIHSNGEDKKIIEEHGVFETLNILKRQGLIRAFGMSTKTVEGGLLAVDLSDVVMVTFNPMQTEEKSVITHAHLKQKGVFVKKALMSGHVKNPIRETIQFIFQEPGVSSVIVGTLNQDHLKEWIE